MASHFGRSVFGFCLLTSFLITGTGCGTKANDTPTPETDPSEQPSDQPTQMTACQKAFGAACGASCTADDGCEQGLHCDGRACAAECVQSSDCKKGACSDAGRCVEDDDITLNPTQTDPTDTTEAPKCIEGEVEFKAVVPQVWLLLDRSGSMSDSLATTTGSTTRWSALGAVLLGDPQLATDHGVVGDFQDRVAFGAVFYTTGSGTGCVLDLESVALAANNYRDIRQRYNKLGPSGGTPTADSIAATVAVAASSDLTGGPKILVLATDGEPGGCAPRSGTATAEVEGEVAKAFGKHIQTFAISISTGTDIAHMQRVANIGVGSAPDAPTPAKLYTADNQDALKLAFSTILTDVPRSCVFSLNGRVKSENASEGSVVLDGNALAYEDENGWKLKAPDQVELLGDACTQVQAGDDQLDINFPCRIFVPVK